MRELPHPQPIAIKDILVTKIVDEKQVQAPYEFTFLEFLDYVAQLQNWKSGGSNDEMGARLGALVRLQDAAERTKPGQKIIWDNDDHDTLMRILREGKMGEVIGHPRVASKSQRFVFAIAVAARTDEKKDEKPAKKK